MATLRATLSLRPAYPHWLLALLWFVASYAGGTLFSIPAMLVVMPLGLDRITDAQAAGQFSPRFLTLATVLVGAAFGSTIGLAQWLVLRRPFAGIGMWVAATIAGYASVGIIAAFVGGFWIGWQNWAATLIVNGKLMWLARLSPDWPDAQWLPGAITLTAAGALLGVLQWHVLRGHVRRAGWWVAITAAGWALGATLSASQDAATATFAAWDVPLVAQAAGIVWLMNRRLPERWTST